MLLKRMVVMKFHFFRKDNSHVLRNFITPLNYYLFLKKKIKIKKKKTVFHSDFGISFDTVSGIVSNPILFITSPRASPSAL